ncbi:MAG: Family 2 glycosyl transferase [Candidatus Amesbacteria bacterium GW2011_GWA2_47_11b]|uniref:Family 2 glycosyl transferase n=2 Tax=Candidatus Amesiibacteriota TaxID=1752730 RepID=A0A0G1SLG2_9BACT|nr:MAG: Family 2 glycosyl transferase [Candidatus Curtissbacteria bacterium GW2011_GWB1_40_28]KKU29398.1 MAG: Family 2 glycosyl transferase [Microgenomates group bacterium GW2011_GWC1_46_20]KKU58500.1 MAG: Family 2 glycosyl transferase [Candidatus Amesbacteria bacterium GW2011_GWA2_47_11b]KKU70339.1 MAG: Family 2 glycosyl transferase [Candidatus Amesbacteria bacterium GW2011_GWA1_47_20]HCH59278.1 hypothetical protein [Candidatus Zambryskibacteria bacterium]
MTKSCPTISIAIPTFNEGPNIKRCLDSIFRQKYPGKLEVFVIDDNSIDNTVAIAKKYPVVILKNGTHDLGIGKKIGFDQATGKYFLFMDADIDLCGTNWFTKLINPLEADSTLCSSFTGYYAYPDDKPLNKYITLDFLQRDPLFIWLTPSLNEVVIEKKQQWWVCKYTLTKMLTSGMCVHRKSLLDKYVKDKQKFMELDTVAIYVKNGHDRFAYVPNAGMHHPFIDTLRRLVFKRVRNLSNMYFDQKDARQWTWIDWSKPADLLKIFIWVIYANSIILPFLMGIFKSIKHKTWVAMYELPFTLITTNLLIWGFVSAKNGRKLLTRVFAN